MFTPSTYQKAIFDWIDGGRGDGIVNAVAGSGKTTTLTQAAGRLHSGSSVMVAFNKHIAEELQRKLKGTRTEAKTVHSIGNGALYKRLGKTQLDDRKYRRLSRQYADTYLHLSPEFRKAAAGVLADLAKMCRLTLIDPRDQAALVAMCSHYGIDVFDGRLLTDLPALLDEGERLAENGKIIDFTDMVYLPLRWNLSVPKWPWVMADECQDFSACVREFVLRLRAPGGRMLFVGDPHQSIMGFAGADNLSFQRIQERTDALALPLSICYRCPTSHLVMAREIVPQIEARPDAPTGTIQHVQAGELLKQAREGDLVLCRMTAPLVKECIRLIRQRVPARVRGRDIGKDLCSLLQQVEQMDGFTYNKLSAYLERYRLNRVTALVQREAEESQIESINDRVECLQVCAEGFTNARSVADLCQEIESLFSEERASIWLSTVHRAKGLEAERVFILHPDKLPLRRRNQQPWELEQEMNLRYVALTRAKDTMTFLEDSPPEAERKAA